MKLDVLVGYSVTYPTKLKTANLTCLKSYSLFTDRVHYSFEFESMLTVLIGDKSSGLVVEKF